MTKMTIKKNQDGKITKILMIGKIENVMNSLYKLIKEE